MFCKPFCLVKGEIGAEGVSTIKYESFFTSRAAAESNRGVGSEEDDFCFLAMVSPFSLLLQLVLIKLTHILIYWGRFVTF